MRVAFYAPLKAPTHPIPSGDRLLARLFARALASAGHEVRLASRLRTWDGAGDRTRQARLASIGARLAERVLRRLSRPGERPHCWFTYHLYYKAPDWLGPRVSAALDIPYVVAEASYAPRQADGPWALGHDATRDAIAAARAVVTLKQRDVPALRPLLAPDAALVRLAPFLDLAPFADPDRRAARAEVAGLLGLDPAVRWLVAVGMMRPGAKLQSFRALADALARLERDGWRLVVVGDGPARAECESVLAGALGERVRFAGRWEQAPLLRRLAAFDLLVWPAVDEAIGMAVLEAQAAGVPAVVGDGGGADAVVCDGRTGRLVPAGDAEAFAGAVRSLLDAPAARDSLAEAARANAFAHHGLDSAARTLDRVLREAVG